VLARLIRDNGASGGTYVEPYAGGAGAALNLLFDEHVDRILINDADISIFAFWRAALHSTEDFVDMIAKTPLTIAEWRRQRVVYKQGRRAGLLKLGFATFFLNRCNRSGIIASGGPIGGLKQKGPWKIDARFNREDLIARVQRLAAYRDRIDVVNLDAIEFLRTRIATLSAQSRPFAYLDPPYFAKGRDLYMNHYGQDDHAALATYVRDRLNFPWLISYDDVEPIRRLYRRLRAVPLQLPYTARERRLGAEVLILQPHLAFPREWRRGVPLTTADAVTASFSRRKKY
jgi:DNA adenine methylase